MRSEVALTSARANVMVYDELTKRWIPASYSSTVCNVEVIHNYSNITYTIIARSEDTHEFVIKSYILAGMRYNEATPIFHQWRDNKVVYGLHFLSRDQAEMFGAVVRSSLEVLNSGGQQKMHFPAPYPVNVADDVKENLIEAGREEDIYEEFEGDIHDDTDEIYQDMVRTAARPLLEHNFNRSLGSFRSPSSRQPSHLMTSSPSRQQQEHYYNPQQPIYTCHQQSINAQNKRQDPFSQSRMFQPQVNNQPQPQFSQPVQQDETSSPPPPTYQVSPHQTYAPNIIPSQNVITHFSASPPSPPSMPQISSQTPRPQIQIEPQKPLSPPMPQVPPPPPMPQVPHHPPMPQVPPPPPLPTAISQSGGPPPPPAPPLPSSLVNPVQLSIKLKTSGDDLETAKLSSNTNKSNTSGGGMANMLEEMKQKLARRKVSCDDDGQEASKSQPSTPKNIGSPSVRQKALDLDARSPFRPSTPSTPTTLTPSKSSASLSKIEVINGSRGLELINKSLDSTKQCSLNKSEIESLKSEILKEIRTEIEKSKLEIIEIIRKEMQRLQQ